MLKIVGNDGIRVVRTIRVDMVNGFFQGVNDLIESTGALYSSDQSASVTSLTGPKFSRMALEA